MKKIVLCSCFLFGMLFIPKVFYGQAFDDGTNLVSIGFGLPPGHNVTDNYDPNNNYIDYKLTNYGTVVLKFEHGLNKYFGMGLNTEYSGGKLTYKYDYTNSLRYERDQKVNVWGFYARFNGHFPVGDKFDIYGGVGLGYLYTINQWKDTNPDPTIAQNSNKSEKKFGFDYQVTLGARYMIKDNIGMFTEVGWATTAWQVGLTFKF